MNRRLRNADQRARCQGISPSERRMSAAVCSCRTTRSLDSLLLTAALFFSVAGVDAVLGLDSSSARAQTVVVARVNGESITDRELQRLLAQSPVRRELPQQGNPTRVLPDPSTPQKLDSPAPDAKRQEQAALKRLVSHRLLLQEAARRNLVVTEQEVTQAQAVLRRRFKDDESYIAWRKTQDLADDKSLRDALRSELLVARVGAALVRTNLNEKVVRTYYETHKTELQVPAASRMQLIAVREKAAADAIVTALKQGEDFGRLAQQQSKGARAAQGGDLGWVSPAALPPTLRMAAGTLKVGETSDVLQMGPEFLIVRLVARRPERMKSLEEAQPEIKQRLQKEAQPQIIASWLAKQERQSQIEILR